MRKVTGITSLIMALFLVSCAIITVNIYFPEKDVKEAYKALEKELMTPGPGQTEPPKTSPDVKPQSFNFDFVSTAYAETAGLADKIAETVKRMPDVVKAYEEMGARRAQVDRLRDSGAVGEANSGLLVPRERDLNPEEKELVERENENRRTVIRGMAKAIVRINRLPENEDNIKQVLPQATQQFAAVRHDSAKKGWWIQNPDGNWVKK